MNTKIRLYTTAEALASLINLMIDGDYIIDSVKSIAKLLSDVTEDNDTVILISIMSPWEKDMTGIVIFPALFCGIIARCVYDWLFIIKTVIFTTVKYGCEHILKRTVKYIG